LLSIGVRLQDPSRSAETRGNRGAGTFGTSFPELKLAFAVRAGVRLSARCAARNPVGAPGLPLRQAGRLKCSSSRRFPVVGEVHICGECILLEWAEPVATAAPRRRPQLSAARPRTSRRACAHHARHLAELFLSHDAWTHYNSALPLGCSISEDGGTRGREERLQNESR
jgi:hypothetical protein